MKRKVIAGILSVLMGMTLMTGCGGSAAPQGEAAEPAAESTASTAEEAEDAAAESTVIPSDESVAGETPAAGEDSLMKTVSTFMAEHGRPVGDLIVDLEVPEPDELTEEEGAELDRAMRAYTPSADSLLINNAKNFYFYSKLDSDQQSIYDSILMLAEDPTNTDNIAVVEIPKPLDDTYFNNTIAPAYYALLYDHPELFWLYSQSDNHLVFGSLAQNGKTLLYLGYDEPYKNYEQDMKAFNQAATEFLKDINLKGTNTEIADAIHDKLIDMVVYDNYVAENMVSADLAHSAYGALVANSRGEKNTCVCDGYSLAYVYLCQQAGLDAAFLCGMAGANAAEAGGHAWSAVNIDGKWKEVDSCWDDWDDMFDMLIAEFGKNSDADSKKIVQAVSDPAYLESVEHYLDRVSTEYITNFKDVESFVYPFSDGTALVLITESVHVRMDNFSNGGPDAALMKLAPIAE